MSYGSRYPVVRLWSGLTGRVGVMSVRMYFPLDSLGLGVFVLVTLAACTPAPAQNAPPVPSAAAPASPSPAVAAAAPRPAGVSLMFIAPTVGETVSAGPVTVSVGYSGPALVPAANATKLDDYHLHYFLDVDPTPYIGTTVPVPLGDPRIVHTAATTVTFDNVAPGTHTLAVMMSGSNHISVNPPVADQESFTAR
jgi:hypothetical protein